MKSITTTLFRIATVFLCLGILIITYVTNRDLTTLDSVLLWIMAVILIGMGLFLLLLLYLNHSSKKKNHITTGLIKSHPIPIDQLTDKQILERLFYYIDLLIVSMEDTNWFEEWLNNRFDYAPREYYPFLIIRFLQIASHLTLEDGLDVIFIHIPKIFIDDLTEQLYEIEATDLASKIQYYKAIYPEHREEILLMLRQKEEYLNRCIVAYIRNHKEIFE